ncbi:MAG: GNAT family N-acetyltransferase, partial [Candidatus Electrothrix sp. AR1]|nr:GNAT family N-acetyltransferase [Candidatus Electrothrix sp. AR1]
MKIRKLTPENFGKAYALLRKAFPRSTYEIQLAEKFHKNGKVVHE